MRSRHRTQPNDKLITTRVHELPKFSHNEFPTPQFGLDPGLIRLVRPGLYFMVGWFLVLLFSMIVGLPGHFTKHLELTYCAGSDHVSEPGLYLEVLRVGNLVPQPFCKLKLDAVSTTKFPHRRSSVL